MINSKKIATAIVSGALATLAFAPGVFAYTEVKENGVGSKNYVTVKSTCVSGVWQKNDTTAMTHVYATSNSGDNSASFNTGGSVGVDAGPSTTAVGVVVVGGSNTATAPDCCDCVGGNDTAKVVDNGAFSHNSVYTSSTSWTNVSQSSNTTAYTGVTAKSNSGGNKASFNTSKWGNVHLGTGAAKTYVGVGVIGGNNTVTP